MWNYQDTRLKKKFFFKNTTDYVRLGMIRAKRAVLRAASRAHSRERALCAHRGFLAVWGLREKGFEWMGVFKTGE